MEVIAQGALEDRLNDEGGSGACPARPTPLFRGIVAEAPPR